MRLDSVEIVGFKSFCDRQELSFRGGVTGIVGPNGCGKSNISDAISWVLGEQSVKSLRGTAMEDVIFAGSQSRQPLAMAEVNLKVSGLNGNSPDGRDHWPYCYTSVVAGAGIKRGYVHGESDKTGSAPRKDPVHPIEILATIYHSVGIDPHTMVDNHLKQPRELVQAEPVTGLFA